MRAVPVFCVLLVVCVAIGGAATMPAATPTAEPTGGDAAAVSATATNATGTNASVNVSRILALPSGDAPHATIEPVSLDAGIAVGFGTNVSAMRMETLALRETVETAPTADARSQEILQGTNEVEQRAVTLRTRYRTAVASYAAGDISATELLVELATVRAKANALADRIRVLVELAEATEGFSLESGRVQPLLFDLDTFGGPVTDRAVAVIRGGEDRARFYVAASGSNVVLTTVTDGEYVREAYLATHRELDGSTIQPAAARNVTARSYPEIWAARTSTSGAGEGGTFVYEVVYPTGRLTAFVDGGTERVFKEYQHVNLSAFSSGPVVNDTQNGLTLSVNRTYAGGPLRVSVVDADTGEAVNATVRLGSGGDSDSVGRTGDDGVLWTLSPRGQYYVTAVETGTTNAVIIDEILPVDPATVAEAYDGNVTAGASGTTPNATTSGTTTPSAG